mmetsp:Transcript_7040/g.14526  ORF Transcript_7040/g.14526 Transcript_7040/m.14526 type:complete len:364 (-) Transcript_7040:131-1222(-)
MFLVASIVAVVGIVVAAAIVVGIITCLAATVGELSLLFVVLAFLLLLVASRAHGGIRGQTRGYTFRIGASLLHRLFFVFSFELASLFVQFHVELGVFLFLFGSECDHVLDILSAIGKRMKLASCLDLPSPLFHLETKLFDQLGNLLGPLLFPFVLDLSSLVSAVVSVPGIDQLWGWCIGRTNGSCCHSCAVGTALSGGTKGKLVLVRMKAIDGFSVVVRVWIVLDGKAQSSLVLHEIGPQLNRGIKQVKGRKLSGGSSLVGICRLFLLGLCCIGFGAGSGSTPSIRCRLCCVAGLLQDAGLGDDRCGVLLSSATGRGSRRSCSGNTGIGGLGKHKVCGQGIQILSGCGCCIGNGGLSDCASLE